MPPRPARRFSIAEIMILVPAPAVGIPMLRAEMPGFLATVGFPSRFIPAPWGLSRWAMP